MTTKNAAVVQNITDTIAPLFAKKNVTFEDGFLGDMIYDPRRYYTSVRRRNGRLSR
jgi:hypothetical protein